MPMERKDRRKVNQPVAVERRKGGADRRRCPDCGSTLNQSVEAAPGGTLTKVYCTKCAYQTSSRQVDEGRLKSLAGYELTVSGSPRFAVLPLEADFMKAADLAPGDTVELKAIYVPGGDTVLSWVLRKL